MRICQSWQRRSQHQMITEGMTFGKLTALRKLTTGVWLCKCSCGTYCTVFEHLMRYRKSCGCGRTTQYSKIGKIRQNMFPSWYTNPTGMMFGDYIVVRRASNGYSNWILKCQKCGHTIKVKRSELLNNYAPVCPVCTVCGGR